MSLKAQLLSIVGGLIVFGVGFLLLDIALMNMQGLGLVFQR